MIVTEDREVKVYFCKILKCNERNKHSVQKQTRENDIRSVWEIERERE